MLVLTVGVGVSVGVGVNSRCWCVCWCWRHQSVPSVPVDAGAITSPSIAIISGTGTNSSVQAFLSAASVYAYPSILSPTTIPFAPLESIKIEVSRLKVVNFTYNKVSPTITFFNKVLRVM